MMMGMVMMMIMMMLVMILEGERSEQFLLLLLPFSFRALFWQATEKCSFKKLDIY